MLQKMLQAMSEYPTLQSAFLHPAARKARVDDRRTFQRLELLGDAVLDLVTTELLLERLPKANEGDLTARRAQLVEERALAEWAHKVKLQREISPLKDAQQLTDRVLADTVEAVIGAVYMDKGFSCAKELITEIISENIDKQSHEKIEVWNAKGALQGLLMQGGKTMNILYQTVSTTGEAHSPRFEVEVIVDGEKLGSATARTKKEAEKQCALQALQTLKERQTGKRATSSPKRLKSVEESVGEAPGNSFFESDSEGKTASANTLSS